jgi:hypothetical protein
MAVIKELENKYREKHHADGLIDQFEWQRFLEKPDTAELNTHCYDCKSPQRICGSLLIHMKKPYGMDAEVIIVDEIMGF